MNNQQAREDLSEVNPASPARYTSKISTTTRHQLTHWIASMVIYPIYLVWIYLCTKYLVFILYCAVTRFDLMRDSQLIFFATVLTVGIGVVSMIPMLLSFKAINRPYWRASFKDRHLQYLVCLCLIAFTLIFGNQEEQQILKLSVTLFLFSGFFWLILHEAKKPGFIPLLSTLTLVLCFVLFLASKNDFIMSALSALIAVVEQSISLLFPVVSVIAYNFWLLIMGHDYRRGISIAHQEPFVPSLWSRITIAIFISSSIVTFVIAYIGPDKINPWARAIFDFTIALLLFTVMRPRLFLSRQRAYWENLWVDLKGAYLRSIASPTLDDMPISQKIRMRFNHFLSIDNAWLGFITGFGLGFVVVPVIQIALDFLVNNQHQIVLSQLFPLGLASGLVFVLIYACLWLLRHLDHYVILPFNTGAHPDKDFRCE